MKKKEEKKVDNNYYNNWQNNKYATDKKYREMKKANAKKWRLKNLDKFRKYQREYQRKLREKNGRGGKNV